MMNHSSTFRLLFVTKNYKLLFTFSLSDLVVNALYGSLVVFTLCIDILSMAKNLRFVDAVQIFSNIEYVADFFVLQANLN